MSNVYDLAAIKQAVDEKYSPLVIEGVTFQPVMRLSKDDRKKVLDAVDAVNGVEGEEKDRRDPDEMLDHIKEILTLVADKDPKKIIDVIGDDIAIGMHIMSLWTAATQPGEADSSPN